MLVLRLGSSDVASVVEVRWLVLVVVVVVCVSVAQLAKLNRTTAMTLLERSFMFWYCLTRASPESITAAPWPDLTFSN
jgi:hypothetical protein